MLFLKAGADPNATVVGPGSTFEGSRMRAATMVSVDFCFSILGQSQPIQALYLKALMEFIHLSNNDILRDTCHDFGINLSNMSDGDELRQLNLSFLAGVTHVAGRLER